MLFLFFGWQSKKVRLLSSTIMFKRKTLFNNRGKTKVMCFWWEFILIKKYFFRQLARVYKIKKKNKWGALGLARHLFNWHFYNIISLNRSLFCIWKYSTRIYIFRRIFFNYHKRVFYRSWVKKVFWSLAKTDATAYIE